MTTLMLLEDDRSLIDGLDYVLRKEGYALDVATTLAEAQTLLMEQSYDLLLLDLTLPDGNGLSVCEQVRAKGSTVPIIFLTAMDEEVQVIRALDTPTSGEIRIDGQNLFAMKEEARTIFRRRNIGFVFQSYQLVPELNVEQNIIFPLLLDYKRPRQAEVDEILQILGLTSRRQHLPSQLSGGQQQRVAIGRALITKPKLILADEPTGNLDSRNSREVIDLLTQASRHYQQTILMITHNASLTASVDRVLRVSDGVLTDLGRKSNEKLS